MAHFVGAWGLGTPACGSLELQKECMKGQDAGLNLRLLIWVTNLCSLTIKFYETYYQADLKKSKCSVLNSFKYEDYKV